MFHVTLTLEITVLRGPAVALQVTEYMIWKLKWLYSIWIFEMEGWTVIIIKLKVCMAKMHKTVGALKGQGLESTFQCENTQTSFFWWIHFPNMKFFLTFHQNQDNLRVMGISQLLNLLSHNYLIDYKSYISPWTTNYCLRFFIHFKWYMYTHCTVVLFSNTSQLMEDSCPSENL